MASLTTSTMTVYKLRDKSQQLVDAWNEYFKQCQNSNIQLSCGDIFKDAPYADAIVSPANSFGFMDGGIDMIYSMHFGWQMQSRLQQEIRIKYDGELPVGSALIIPAYGDDDECKLEPTCNEGKRIKYLICAPTMRVPMAVDDTVNAFLAFRAVILAVKKHNANAGNEPILSVLCPGLGTAIGKMPPDRCAYQMLQAYKIYELGEHKFLREPDALSVVWEAHEEMAAHKKSSKAEKTHISKPPYPHE